MATALGVAAVLALGWWVTHSAIFQARRITVAGNRRLSTENVLRIAGVGTATNVLWFSPSRAVARLESNPWVQSARVSRTLPSGIVISVTERTPVAVLTGARSYLVAGDDTVLGTVRGAWRLPVIPLGRAVVLRPGSRPAAARAEIQAIGALPPGLSNMVAGASVDASSTLVLTLRTGVRVVYGDATLAGAKGQALAAVLDWARLKGVKLHYVDVRAPVTPAAMPVGVRPSAGPVRPVTLAPAPVPSASGR